jgi:hypothetical protein
MKESNEIIISIQHCDDRANIVNILAHLGYEVTVKIITDSIMCTNTYWVIANKLI